MNKYERLVTIFIGAVLGVSLISGLLPSYAGVGGTGGGSSGGAVTNGSSVQIFNNTNQFNKPILGNFTVGLLGGSTTNTFHGISLFGTNVAFDVGSVAIFRQSGGRDNVSFIATPNAGFALYIGDTLSSDYTSLSVDCATDKLTMGGPLNDGLKFTYKHVTFNGGSALLSNFTSTASLGFGDNLTAGQTKTMTFTLTGARAGDAVIPRWPSDLPVTNLAWNMRVTADDTISVSQTAIATWNGSTLGFTNTFGAVVQRY